MATKKWAITRWAVLAAVAFGLLAGAATAQTSKVRPRVEVLTDRDPAVVDFLLAVYNIEARTPARVTYGDRGDLAKWRADDPSIRFDVVWTADLGWLTDAAASEALAVLNAPSITENAPSTLRDPGDRWVGVSQRGRVLHMAAWAADAPETYDALADPAWRGRLCMGAAGDPANLQLIASAILHYGSERAAEWLRGVKANIAGAPEGDDRAQIRAVAEGRCAAALAYDHHRGLLAEAKDAAAAATRIAAPRFKGGGVHVTATAAGLFADGRNQDGARRFLEFLMSDKAQRILMLLSYERPASLAVALEGAVAEWSVYEADAASLAEIAERLGEARALLAALKRPLATGDAESPARSSRKPAVVGAAPASEAPDTK